jgi:hypothetical protein
MAQHEQEALVFQRGDEKSLPHTLSATRHLTVTLVEYDAMAETAVFDLHNPEAEPDSTVSCLVEEAVDDVESANEWRDRLHLPEKAVPVDTMTARTLRLNCTLDEKLEIGDRVWTVTEIAAGGVTLTPGRDHESHSLINKAEDAEYEEPVINAAQKINRIDGGL